MVLSAREQGTKTTHYATRVHISHFPGNRIVFGVQLVITVPTVGCSSHDFARRGLCVTLPGLSLQTSRVPLDIFVLRGLPPRRQRAAPTYGAADLCHDCFPFSRMQNATLHCGKGDYRKGIGYTWGIDEPRVGAM